MGRRTNHDIEGVADGLHEGYLAGCSVVLLSKLGSHDPFGRRKLVPCGRGRCDALQLAAGPILLPVEGHTPGLLPARALGSCLSAARRRGWATQRPASVQSIRRRNGGFGAFLAETCALAAAHLDRFDPVTLHWLYQHTYDV